jgi:molybdopterin-guanine dinucleotide biosynthesis protein A
MEKVAGVILAGGLSRRMGGGDKALRELGGAPLIGRVLARLRPQASPIAINANGDPARFGALGLPVIPDATADFAGPLAGVLAGLRWAAAAAPAARFIVTAACDTPFFPENLVPMLLAATGGAYPSVALAASGGQVHPVFGLWPVALADDLAAALQSGTRKVLHWVERHPHFTADFPFAEAGGRLVDPFFNANTPEELAEAESLLAREGAP